MNNLLLLQFMQFDYVHPSFWIGLACGIILACTIWTLVLWLKSVQWDSLLESGSCCQVK